MSLILVVDDDDIFRSIMKRHLTRMGFDVIENVSGKGVASQIQQHRPVAYLLDLVMDEKEGIETLSEIAELEYRPKVIAVSSNAKYLPLVEDLGADATLQKPIAPDQLKAVLDQLGVVSE